MRPPRPSEEPVAVGSGRPAVGRGGGEQGARSALPVGVMIGTGWPLTRPTSRRTARGHRAEESPGGSHRGCPLQGPRQPRKGETGDRPFTDHLTMEVVVHHLLLLANAPDAGSHPPRSCRSTVPSPSATPRVPRLASQSSCRSWPTGTCRCTRLTRTCSGAWAAGRPLAVVRSLPDPLPADHTADASRQSDPLQLRSSKATAGGTADGPDRPPPRWPALRLEDDLAGGLAGLQQPVRLGGTLER